MLLSPKKAANVFGATKTTNILLWLCYYFFIPFLTVKRWFLGSFPEFSRDCLQPFHGTEVFRANLRRGYSDVCKRNENLIFR